MAATKGWNTDFAFPMEAGRESKHSSSGRTSSLYLKRMSFKLAYLFSISILASSSALALASASALALASASALALAASALALASASASASAFSLLAFSSIRGAQALTSFCSSIPINGL